MNNRDWQEHFYRVYNATGLFVKVYKVGKSLIIFFKEKNGKP